MTLPTGMNALEKLHLALGLVVTARRLDLGLSQDAAALKAGVERLYFGKLERGQNGMVTLAMLSKVAGALGTLPEVLIAEARERVDEVPDDGVLERPTLKAGRRPRKKPEG